MRKLPIILLLLLAGPAIHSAGLEKKSPPQDAGKNVPSVTITPVPIPSPGPSPEDIILCVVDDRRLTQAMVDKMLDQLHRKIRDDPQNLERIKLVYTRNIMQEWLERNLLAKEAEKQGIQVTEDEIEKQEQLLKKASKVKISIDDALRNLEISRQEYTGQIRNALLGEKLVENRLNQLYTEDDMKRIYLENPQSFQRPPRVRASHVFCPLKGNETPEQKELREDFMKKARKEAKKGKDLREVAASSGPSINAIGGDLGWLYRTNRLPPPINALVFQVKVGKTSKVVETEYGYYVIRVEEKQPLFGTTFKEAREVVREALFEQLRKKVLEQARKKHRIIINISGIPEDKL